MILNKFLCGHFKFLFFRNFSVRALEFFLEFQKNNLISQQKKKLLKMSKEKFSKLQIDIFMKID
jgi:hypothetical protein